MGSSWGSGLGCVCDVQLHGCGAHVMVWLIELFRPNRPRRQREKSRQLLLRRRQGLGRGVARALNLAQLLPDGAVECPSIQQPPDSAGIYQHTGNCILFRRIPFKHISSGEQNDREAELSGLWLRQHRGIIQGRRES